MNNQPTNNIMDTKKSITPSGFFGSSSNMIQAREDFMTKEEHEFLLNAAKNITHWDITETHYNEDGTVIYDSEYWKDRVATGNTLNQHDPEINRVIEKMVQRFKKEVDDFFMVDADPTSPAIVRWLPGQFQMPHADKELHEGSNAGKPNDFPWYDLAGLFYLNDDYDGGELYFPQHDIKFKPKAGAAYFFPGDMNYIHGVTEITSGIRYVIPFFWTINKHTGERQPNQLILEK
jgi:predicted 2-oxoglutarate/Fe(II)-dependent dioxygenase YbiX